MKEIKRIETKKGERFYSYSRLQFRWFPIKANKVEELKEAKACIIYDADEETVLFDGSIKEEIHIEEVKPVVNNVIELNSLRSQKQNKSIKLCVCGSILKTDNEKGTGICMHCVNDVIARFYRGEIDKSSPLYDILASIFNKRNIK